jgi:hypothetical protein
MSTILIIDKRHEEMNTYLSELSDEGHAVMGTTAADKGVQLPQNIQVPVNRDHTE